MAASTPDPWAFLLSDGTLPTPLLVYSQALLERALRQIDPALRVYFAVKSCYRPSVLRCLREAGAGAEVMSENEHALARAAGFAGDDILCNGLGRPRRLLEMACREGARIIIDSVDDMRTLLECAGKLRVGLRVKPDLSRFPSAGYGREPNKLGLRPASAEWAAIIEMCQGEPRVEIDMLAAHAVSNATDATLHVELLRQLVELARTMPSVRLLDVGGGFDTAADEALFEELARARLALCPHLELAIEPGRFLVDAAAVVVATVTAVKWDGDHAFLVTDAGTNTLMPFKDARYRLDLPPGQHAVSVVDGITSMTSTVIERATVERVPAVGERMLLLNCGAYTSALSQFWVYDPMPVAFLHVDGTLIWDLTAGDIAAARGALLKLPR